MVAAEFPRVARYRVYARTRGEQVLEANSPERRRMKHTVRSEGQRQSGAEYSRGPMSAKPFLLGQLA